MISDAELRVLILTYEALGNSRSIHQKAVLSALLELARLRQLTAGIGITD